MTDLPVKIHRPARKPRGIVGYRPASRTERQRREDLRFEREYLAEGRQSKAEERNAQLVSNGVEALRKLGKALGELPKREARRLARLCGRCSRALGDHPEYEGIRVCPVGPKPRAFVKRDGRELRLPPRPFRFDPALVPA